VVVAGAVVTELTDDEVVEERPTVVDGRDEDGSVEATEEVEVTDGVEVWRLSTFHLPSSTLTPNEALRVVPSGFVRVAKTSARSS
jgi:hypothetical protein